ncbi:uncharacterized protein TNCV_4081781 [Trichonephila clavipes]|nr:uncharacterized protein TNCV_4081781 [Trichonephila clavipes]
MLLRLLMTAQINTDFVNHLVPLSTEPSNSLVHVGTDACESKINSILRYKDYDSHKSAHKDFQKRYVDNPFSHRCFICDRDDLRTPVTAQNMLLPVEHKIFYWELI